MNTETLIRTVDELGRIVLPAEFRKALNIRKENNVSVTLENNAILIRSLPHSCVICGCNAETAIEVNGQKICSACIDKIKAQ